MPHTPQLRVTLADGRMTVSVTPTVLDECVRAWVAAEVATERERAADPNIPTREPNCTCSDDQLIFVGCDCPRDDKGDVIPHEPVGGDFDDEVLPW